MRKDCAFRVNTGELSTKEDERGEKLGRCLSPLFRHSEEERVKLGGEHEYDRRAQRERLKTQGGERRRDRDADKKYR